jgi:hypothetical protein
LERDHGQEHVNPRPTRLRVLFTLLLSGLAYLSVAWMYFSHGNTIHISFVAIAICALAIAFTEYLLVLSIAGQWPTPPSPNSSLLGIIIWVLCSVVAAYLIVCILAERLAGSNYELHADIESVHRLYSSRSTCRQLVGIRFDNRKRSWICAEWSAPDARRIAPLNLSEGDQVLVTIRKNRFGDTVEQLSF